MLLESKDSLKLFATKRYNEKQNRRNRRAINIPRIDAPCISGGYSWAEDGCGEEAFNKLFTNNQDDFSRIEGLTDRDLEDFSFMRVDLINLKIAFDNWVDKGQEKQVKARIRNSLEKDAKKKALRQRHDMMRNLQEKIHLDVIEVIERENKEQKGSVRKVPKRELNALCKAFEEILDEDATRVK